MLRLEITNGLEQGRVFRLHPGITRIGRNFESQFQIPDPSISGNHCELMVSDEGLLVRDLGSTNGTFIDGEPVQESAIHPGQRLQLGNIDLRLDLEADAHSTVPIDVPELHVAPPPTSSLLPDGALNCVHHPEAVASHQCTQCRQGLCDSCIRVIRRVGGQTMSFCSICNSPCERVASSPELTARSKRNNFLRRLAKTLKLPLSG